MLKLKATVFSSAMLSAHRPRLAQEIARHVYDMARLGVGGLEPTNSVASRPAALN